LHWLGEGARLDCVRVPGAKPNHQTLRCLGRWVWILGGRL
jgi:hypothetical protein